ncbi:MAG: ParB/RepB/Spo0J family partition protein [Rickettsiales bacterium]|nr:ParB/RepB/Spo0J family partition protein [Rickettsiales bacterium]
MNKVKGQNKGLGKGLEALISEIQNDVLSDSDENDNTSLNVQQHENTTAEFTLSVDLIEPGPFQPRKYFDPDSLKELSDSIRRSGLIQPIIVSSMRANGKHSIIAGERRWRASKIAGLNTIPAIIKDISDREAFEVALIENIQRKDLNAVEEAEGYKKLIDNFNYTQEELASVVGKSRSHITNLLRILTLPDTVKEQLSVDVISMGHARALIMAKDPSEASELVVKKGLNVRQTESLIKKLNKGDAASTNDAKQSQAKKAVSKKPVEESFIKKDDDVIKLEQMLSSDLGLDVIIDDSPNGGKVEIKFYNLEDLDKILQRLSRGTSL